MSWNPPSAADLIAAAACPPSGNLADNPYPIDEVEQRITLQTEALQYPLETIKEHCCDQFVLIATSLKKIEQYLGRLVNKELKGTGVALAEIASYLKTIALSNVGEHSLALQVIQEQILFGPPQEPVEPFAQAPEPSLTPELEGSFTGQGEIISPQPVQIEIAPPPPPLPVPVAPPQFPPEQSAAVGGDTIPIPISQVPTDKPPGIELQPDFLNPEEVLA